MAAPAGMVRNSNSASANSFLSRAFSTSSSYCLSRAVSLGRPKIDVPAWFAIISLAATPRTVRLRSLGLSPRAQRQRMYCARSFTRI